MKTGVSISPRLGSVPGCGGQTDRQTDETDLHCDFLVVGSCAYTIQDLQQCALRRISLPVSRLELANVGIYPSRCGRRRVNTNLD